nr:YafY family protein [uncultured Eisenbergiella sp.]
MKIDRLMAILTILLRQEKITAPELADRLEVSRRTISRDLDALCRAGIPIVTEQGYGGGISLASGFKIDNSLLTEKEREALLTGIRGLDSVAASSLEDSLREKLRMIPDKDMAPQETVNIDLASFYKDSLTGKLDLLKEAVREHRLVSFLYYSRTGEGRRLVEPYRIVFRWSSWYLLAYCRERKDFRMFKLNRLWKPETEKESFSPRPVPEEKLYFSGGFTDEIRLRAKFSEHVKYRLIEEYGPSSFTYMEDGSLLVEDLGFTNYPVLLEWALGFGSSMEVLEPERLRQDIRKEASRILGMYDRKDLKE